MSEQIKITIDKPKQLNIPGWGNVLVGLTGKELFMLKCVDDIKIGTFINELDKVTEGFVCTPEMIKEIDWEFTGSCSENPYPFDVDFYSFHHWLLTSFK
ncbi:MAG: hypothetical protein HXK00_00190 [Abiotrophia defectiva]|uniref:Uncharacterized protein n=1 Tax=Abiotrophia defectiva TaxID=46125 RepID=A0A929MMS8_ABIDE|nr:hypothetical protein [Abiotrophia defectiva]